MKTAAALLILCFIIWGCRKNGGPQVNLNGPLTVCNANYTCFYNYYDRAHVTGSYPQLQAGSSRVFVYKSVDSSVCDLTVQLSFETSLSDNTFVIDPSRLPAGAFSTSCICCDFAYFPTTLSGEIKGKRTDNTHWLINATIITSDTNHKPLDTLLVNQYFQQQKLP